jgi:capsid assembly protease
MSNKYPNVVRAFSAQTWAMEPLKLAAIIEVIQARMTGGYIPADVIAEHKAAAAARRSQTPASGAVAVIPVYGTISQRMGMMSEMSGGASTEQIGAQIDAALANPQVSAIVLDIDSPGGSVSGVPELAAKIKAARGQKPIIAVANSLMASAAYWIGSAADEIVASPSADVGSIGVYQAHLDASAALEAEGLKYTLISAGKHKVDANPYEALSDEAREHLQAGVDEWYGAFVNAVASHRGVSAKDVRTGYGEGRVLTAKAAKAAGMVDRVATLDDVLADLTGGKGARSRRSASVDLIDRVAATLMLTPNMLAPDSDAFVAALEASHTTEVPTSIPATADEATVVAVPTTLEPASQARSITVQNDNTAANGAAGEAPVSREVQIGQLAQIAGKDLAWTMNAITSGKSVAAIQLDLSAERAQTAAPATAAGIRVGVERETQKPFKSLGENLMAVVNAGKAAVTGSGVIDPRLNRFGAASGMNESVGSEGGFLVHPEFLPEITQSVFENDPILSRAKQIPISAGKQSITYNVIDETSRATGSRSGGVQVYWAAEADTVTAKKPKLRQMKLEKKKLIGIAYLTEELSEDAAAAQSLVVDAFTKEFGFTVANAMFRGSGAGQPLGFLNSPAVVSQAIEASQTIANTASSIAANVSGMLARIPASLWSQVIWLYNQELLPKFVGATVGNSPVFLGAGGASNMPHDTILGKPAFASELCEAQGTVGDLIALVPSEYHVIGSDKPEYQESIHVRFLYGENTLRFTTRTDGAPVWNSAVTRFKGSATLSPFVTLAARS